ncbi:MAG: sigma 54-interacting transcriptional regulator [Wenzhouxiangellaceae bacterium]|nr:sigma 54-interacting transcriptional regulator [Wenzhouxiangellaceae bacterium]
MSTSTDAKPAASVMLIDDDPGLLRLMAMRLESSGFDVETAGSADEALGRIATGPPDVVVTDLRMQGMDGMALFRHLRDEMPTLPVVIMTAHGTIPDAVDATREGAFAFLTKPFDSGELVRTVEEAAASSGVRGDQAPGPAGIVTQSPMMKKLLAEVELIAQSEASVLIIGESGTGKELLARAIHASSPRADGQFVALNCNAVPADLLEAELFGHTRGAFTGAEQAREGLFAHARGGTLFLDEIGDMPMPFQGKLLRAVQERSMRPVGSNSEIDIDVRLVSATHRNLDDALARGEFREDLYYRLNVVTLELPPLRDRPEDIPLLADHFLGELTQNLPASRRIGGFSRDAIRALVEYRWPGNIRQLRNVVEQAVAFCRKGPIPADLVLRALRDEATPIPSLVDARSAFERDYLARVLRMASGNVSEAARLAQRNRTEFYRLLKRHHLDPGEFKRDD